MVTSFVVPAQQPQLRRQAVASPRMLLDDPQVLSDMAFSTTPVAPPAALLVVAGLLCVQQYVFMATGVMQKESLGKWEIAAAAEAKEKLARFGWLQVDHSVPLPSLVELRDGCHRVGMLGGDQVYLCTEPDVGCELSDEFSKHCAPPNLRVS